MFNLMTEEITIESLESDIQFDRMYKDVLISFITESDNETNSSTSTTLLPTAGSAPSTTEKEMSNGPSKFRKFVDSAIDFISDIINKAQSYLIAFFTDKEIVMNIKKINDIVNKTRLKTSYQADTFGQTSPYVNKMFTTINMYKFNELIFTYYNKMVHDKEHAVDILKKYEEERKKLINSGDATIQFSISQFLKEININDYKNHILPTLKRQNNNAINNINSEIRNIDESDTEKKRVYTNYLNYMRRLLNYQLRDIKLLISSFRYNVERAYKIGELGMKNSRVSII